MKKDEFTNLLHEVLYTESDNPVYQYNMILINGIAIPQLNRESRRGIGKFLENLFLPLLDFLEVKPVPLFIPSEQLRGDLGAFEDGEQGFLATPKPCMALVDLSDTYAVCYLFFIGEEHYESFCKNREPLVKHLVLTSIAETSVDYAVSSSKVVIGAHNQPSLSLSCTQDNRYAILYQYVKDMRLLHPFSEVKEGEKSYVSLQR